MPNYVKTPPMFMRFAATETVKQYLSVLRTNISLKVFALENCVQKHTENTAESAAQIASIIINIIYTLQCSF